MEEVDWGGRRKTWRFEAVGVMRRGRGGEERGKEGGRRSFRGTGRWRHGWRRVATGRGGWESSHDGAKKKTRKRKKEREKAKKEKFSEKKRRKRGFFATRAPKVFLAIRRTSTCRRVVPGAAPLRVPSCPGEGEGRVLLLAASINSALASMSVAPCSHVQN